MADKLEGRQRHDDHGVLRFDVDLSQPEPIPAAGIERVVALMQDGRLHRYGEIKGSQPEPSLLEQE